MKNPVNYLTDDVFGTGAVAALLGCCPDSVARMIDRGTIAGRRLPGSRFRRVDRAELIHFLTERGEWAALTRLGVAAGSPTQTGFATVGGAPVLFIVYPDGRPADMVDLAALAAFMKARNGRDKRRRMQ